MAEATARRQLSEIWTRELVLSTGQRKVRGGDSKRERLTKSFYPILDVLL